MKSSTSIGKIAPALLKAQSLMGAALKGSKNPYFKSNYADLGAVLEACKELLNANGVVILQPHVGHIVETILLHESGEWLSSETAIVAAKENDPQAYGSAITYARRYGLQSFLSMPAEDDDGERAMARKPLSAASEPVEIKKTNSWRKAKSDAPAAAPAPSALVSAGGSASDGLDF
jgi:hypothetical protein